MNPLLYHSFFKTRHLFFFKGEFQTEYEELQKLLSGSNPHLNALNVLYWVFRAVLDNKIIYI